MGSEELSKRFVRFREAYQNEQRRLDEAGSNSRSVGGPGPGIPRAEKPTTGEVELFKKTHAALVNATARI